MKYLLYIFLLLFNIVLEVVGSEDIQNSKSNNI